MLKDSFAYVFTSYMLYMPVNSICVPALAAFASLYGML